MRRGSSKVVPFSIYPGSDLRRRLEDIAERRGRSINKQILQFLERAVERFEQRERERSDPPASKVNREAEACRVA